MDCLPPEVMAQLTECLLQEATELLTRTEESLLQLEKNPANETLVQEVFRAMHTLKGSSASIGFTEMASFAHEVEAVLAQLKHGRKVTPQLVSILLKCVDTFRIWFEGIRRGKPSYDASNIVTMLHSIDSVETTNCIQNPEPSQVKTPQSAPTSSEVTITSQPTSSIPPPEPSSDGELVTLPMVKIENLLDLFGEQVILQSLLENVKENLVTESDLAKRTINQLSKITYQLQNMVMGLRMVSLQSFFVKMQRTVRDTSEQLGKQIKIEVSGEDTEIDKHMVDRLSGFATHLVRNSIDHGIESPSERLAAGKPEKGEIHLNAYIHGGFFYLDIVDDGRGVNRARVRSKAIEAGLIKESDELSDQEIVNLIFKPGFSTKEVATELSGRGYGMDIVHHEVSRMRGTLNIESEEGISTKVSVRLPLTMAIFNGVIVRVSSEHFIISSSEISDITRIHQDRCRPINQNETLVEINERVVPLVPVQRTLRIPATSSSTTASSLNSDMSIGVAIQVKHKGKEFALQVDELLGLQRVVLKNLGREIRNCPGVAGGAVLADGSVALVLETDKVIELYEQQCR